MNTSKYQNMNNRKKFAYCCSFGFIDGVKEVLSDNSLSLHETYYQAAFIEACELGHKSIVKLILDDGRIYPTNFSVVREFANFHKDILKILFEDKRFNPNIKKHDFFINICLREDISIIKLFTNHKKISFKGFEAKILLYLLYQDRRKAYNFLIKNKHFRHIKLDTKFLKNVEVQSNNNIYVIKNLIKYNPNFMESIIEFFNYYKLNLNDIETDILSIKLDNF